MCVCVVCRNVPGSSAPTGTQLAIDGRTLRAVLEQPGRRGAVTATFTHSSLQTRGEAKALSKVYLSAVNSALECVTRCVGKRCERRTRIQDLIVTGISCNFLM